MTTWHSISVNVPPEAAEAIEFALNSLEALGTEINHLRKKNADEVTIVGYFNDLPDEERVQDELHFALRAYGLGEETVLGLERRMIEETDWLAEWKKHWRPSEVGNFIVAPPWSEVEDNGKIVIRIEPNMAFGTGTHETTQLCLRAIERLYQPGDSFLDVGTGTGILAIAAAKLSNFKSEISNFQSETSSLKAETSDLKSETSDLRSEISNLKLSESTSPKSSESIGSQTGLSPASRAKIIACDTDADSVAIAIENAELNGVDGAVEFRDGSISSATDKFDFVTANLTLDVIEPLLPVLIEKSRKTLLMSGILAEQEGQIVKALTEHGITDPTIDRASEWISVVVNF
jgi:ribosomal protein L11 methyltransferase